MTCGGAESDAAELAADVEPGPGGAALRVGQQYIGVIGQPHYICLGRLQRLHAIVAGVVPRNVFKTFKLSNYFPANIIS